MTVIARLRHDLWWLVAGTGGMLLAILAGIAVAPASAQPRWTGIGLEAVLGGVTTALVGPRLLPLAQQAAAGAVRRGRRLRPLTQGATTGLIAAFVAFVGVTLFPGVLAPVHVQVGRGLPDVLLPEVVWAVPAAGATGALLGLLGWALVRQRAAAGAFVQLALRAGSGTHLAWAAALVTLVAAAVTPLALSAGAPGGGPVAERAAGIVASGPSWPLTWALWGAASVGLLAVLVLLVERAQPTWRLLGLAVAAVAIATDLVATAMLAAGLPAAAPAAVAGDPALFATLEAVALAISGPVANTLYGVLGLALVRAAGRALHPLLRLLGAGAFAAVLVNALVLPLAPEAVAPVAAVSLLLFVAFAFGFGWQLAVSRRAQPALESVVRRAVRALVPLHPLPTVASVRDLAVVDVAVDPAALESLLPAGTRPRVVAGRAHVLVVGTQVEAARFAFLPSRLGLPATPLISLRVPVVDTAGEPAVAFLRGWSDSTLTAATLHWTTGFELSRVDLVLGCDGEHWSARGRAGSVELDLEAADDAPGLETGLDERRALIERGDQVAVVSLDHGAVSARPARVRHARVPFLERLGAEVVGAVFLADTEHRVGRARWREAR